MSLATRRMTLTGAHPWPRHRMAVMAPNSLTSPCEQQEIAIRIANDEGACAPPFGSQRLHKLDARFLILDKERLCILQRDRRDKQLLGVAPEMIDDGIVHLAKVQSRAVAEYLTVERRLTVGEGDGETEHP